MFSKQHWIWKDCCSKVSECINQLKQRQLKYWFISHLEPSLRYRFLESHCWLDAVQYQCNAVLTAVSCCCGGGPAPKRLKSSETQYQEPKADFKIGSCKNIQMYSCERWNLCCLTLLILCSLFGSGRPAAPEGEHTAPTPAFYEDYTPPTYGEKTHATFLIPKYILCFVFINAKCCGHYSELWPHMHQRLKQNAGWTWPPQAGPPAARQPQWPWRLHGPERADSNR